MRLGHRFHVVPEFKSEDHDRAAMQVVTIQWRAEKAGGTDFASLLEICDAVEVLAHLDVADDAIRALLRCDFKEGMGPEDLSDTDFLKFESVIPSKDAGPPPVVVLCTHPLAVAGIQHADIAILPPYGIDEDGITITVRGVPSGVAGFLGAARAILPPDKVTVKQEEGEDAGVRGLLGERQLEVVQAAVHHGYYDDPKRISMRALAERLGMARSTLGEHLHNAEATLIKWVASLE